MQPSWYATEISFDQALSYSLLPKITELSKKMINLHKNDALNIYWMMYEDHTHINHLLFLS